MNEILKIRDMLKNDLSLWQVDAPNQDVFMIGNGRVSAVLGWGDRLTDMGWVLGPYYENSFNRTGFDFTTHFGTQTARLLDGTIETEWKEQKLARARQTCIMFSSQANKYGLRWEIIDYCSTQKDVITRIMIFENESNCYSPSYNLELGWEQPKESKKSWSPEFCVQNNDDTGDKLFNISVQDSSGRSRKLTASYNVPYDICQNKVIIGIPPVAQGESFVVIQCFSIYTPKSTEIMRNRIYETNQTKTEIVSADLTDTIQHWSEWSNSGSLVKTSELWFDDLLDSAKIWCKVQQSAHGVFTPMIFYSDAYVRDCNGPVRLFLRLGMFKEVEGVLDFFKKAAIFNRLNNIDEPYSGVNNIRLDVDNFPEGIDIDWSQVDPGKAEIPSWIILWNWWYYVQTGDISYIEKNWSFLIRCLDSQNISSDGFICFHGDETYKYLGVAAFTGVDRPQYVKMFDSDENKYSSLEATVLYMYAYDAMKTVAIKLNREDSLKYLETSLKHMADNIEKIFWNSTDNCYCMAYGGEGSTFENPHTIVLSTPCWLDAFTDASDTVLNTERKRASWEKSFDFLEKEGWINASPYLPVTDGHLPGFMLSGAAIYDPSKVNQVIEKVKTIATPAGAFAEFYTHFNAEGARGYHGKAWGRLRPWESGVNLESMLFAITGIRFDYIGNTLIVNPCLPDGWNFFKIEKFRCLDTSVTLRIERHSANISWSIFNEGSHSINVKHGEEILLIKPGDCFLK